MFRHLLNIKSQPSPLRIPSNFDLETLPSKVLIVDDDTFNIVSMELALSKFQSKTERAFNGSEAIEKILSTKFDLVLMDCNMPVLNGWEATKKIKELVQQGKIDDIPIIACTAYEDLESIEKCKEAGMSYIINKPITNDKLKKILKMYGS